MILLIEISVNVNYLVNGLKSTIPTKMICEEINENEFRNVHFEVNFSGNNIISKPCDMIKYAIIYLQNALPNNMSIVCCGSCMYGNFCPFGGNDKEIFCLKGFTPNNKSEVCNIFTNNSFLLEERSRKLLDFCEEYNPISVGAYYTYNDWEYIMKHSRS